MSTSIVLLLVEKMVDEDNTWVTFISGKGDGQKDSERPTQDPPSQPQGTFIINHILAWCVGWSPCVTG